MKLIRTDAAALDAGALRAVADHYVRHEFNVLGSGWVRVYHGMHCAGFEGYNYSRADVGCVFEGPLAELARTYVPGYVPIDWHIDFKSGYRYPLDHHSRLRYGAVPGVDAKVPSDLSRGYHLVTLALAWRATGDACYRREALAQMLDWLVQNPFEYGPAWRANMNVAIRAANWSAALDVLGGERGTFDEAVRRSLLDHRRYIAANLEFSETVPHPNHYVANLAGMLVLCAYLGESDPEAAAWRRLALRELGRELDTQVLDDGFDYESTTAYHALVLEMVTFSLLAAARAGAGAETPAAAREWITDHLGAARLEKLRAMFAVLRDITQPDGCIPLAGDTDSGRFLHLETPGHDGRDWRFLGGVGAALFEDAALLAESWSPEHGVAAALLLGASPPATAADPQTSAAYPCAGFYLLRGPGFHSLISCGPIGAGGTGGHAHNDRLALTLSIDGREILVDPGVYVYTASRRFRDLYRSVAAHNTVMLAGEEQNRYPADSPWWGCYDDTRCRALLWERGEDRDIFVGEHHGYGRLMPPVIHRRRIEWWKRERRVEIFDEMQSEAAALPAMVWSFLLHPRCRVERIQGSLATILHADLRLDFITAAGTWRREGGFFSPAYGVREDCSRLLIEMPAGARRNRVSIQARGAGRGSTG